VLKVFGSIKTPSPDDERRNRNLIKLVSYSLIPLICGLILLGCQLAGILSDMENPWCLVMGFIAFGCLTCMLIFMGCPYRPYCSCRSGFFAIPVAFCAYLILFLSLLGLQLDGLLSFQSSWALVVLLPIVFVVIALLIFYCLSKKNVTYSLEMIS
jgi:hypothetical protein